MITEPIGFFDPRLSFMSVQTHNKGNIGSCLVSTLAFLAFCFFSLAAHADRQTDLDREAVKPEPLYISDNASPASAFLKREGNTLILKGVPFREMGANKYGLFHQFLGITGGNPRRALDGAVAAGISFLRVAAVGFYPTDMCLWRASPKCTQQASPERYWAAFDQMVHEAKIRGLKLVPVIMWNTFLFPDLAGEPVSRLFIENSKARELLFSYAQELVTRYRDEDTILFWELTNEMNLSADINYARLAKTLIRIPAGTPASRSAADNFSTEQMAVLLHDLAVIIKTWDPNALISSGYSAPRPYAQHLRNSPAWSARGPDWTPDSLKQMKQYIKDTHPDPIDIVSVHLYNSGNQEILGVTGKYNPDALDYLVEAADDIQKPLYLGEYGDIKPWVNIDRKIFPNKNNFPIDPRGNFSRRTMLKLLDLRIPVSSFWTWSAPPGLIKGSIQSGVSPLLDELIGFFKTTNGWLEAASTARSTVAPVTNSGFETDADGNGRPDGWERVWTSGNSSGYSAGWSWDKPFEGKRILRLNNGTGDPSSFIFVLSDPVRVKGEEDLILSAASRPRLGKGGIAYIRLIQYNSAGLEIDEKAISIGPGGGWKYKVDVLRDGLKKEARSVRIELSVGGAEGQLMDVDDVRLSIL